MTHRIYHVLVLLLALTAALVPPGAARAYDRSFEVVLNAQGQALDAYLVNGSPFPPRVVFIDPDPPEPDNLFGPPPRVGRYVNGKLCFFPRGFGHNGQFVIADDTYRSVCLDRNPPQARCSVTDRRSRLYVGRNPDGWGVFRRNGKWTKLHIHTEWDFSGPTPQGNIDPQGCAFDANGNLWGTDVGHGDFGNPDGSLIVFFPGARRRYDTYCFVDKALAAPGMPAVDAAGNLYVPEAAGAQVTKFSPPFPSSAADCANPERLVTTPPTKSVFLDFAGSGLFTPAGIVRIPGTDHFYVGSVAIPEIINEYDRDGLFVRTIASGLPLANPLGIDVGSDGTVYYSELNLKPDFSLGCGRVSMVRFDALGQPLPPELLGQNLRFPDGVTVVNSRRFRVNLRKLPPAPDLDPSQCGGE
jgi:hypothetical protein